MENYTSTVFKKGTGTPPTLRKALQNGLEAIQAHPDVASEEVLLVHLRDFLSQKFFFVPNAAEHPLKDVVCPRATWNRIFPEDQR